jgi:hypothetical protein
LNDVLDGGFTRGAGWARVPRPENAPQAAIRVRVGPSRGTVDA